MASGAVGRGAEAESPAEHVVIFANPGPGSNEKWPGTGRGAKEPRIEGSKERRSKGAGLSPREPGILR